jgi:hypothetical protein
LVAVVEVIFGVLCPMAYLYKCEYHLGGGEDAKYG